MARGRRPQGEYSGKSVTLSTIITPELRANLDKAAKANGRSLSQEVEHRLRGSFIDEGEITDRFGDRKNYAFLRLLSLVTEVWWSQRFGPKRRHWTDDPVQYAQVETATKAVLAALRPNGRRRRDGDIDPEAVGWFQAGAILNDLRSAGEGSLEASYVENQILSDIGKMIDRVPADFFRSETIRRAMKDEGE